MAECFDLELKDGVAHLRMNRPEAMNTMTPAFWRELPALVNELSDAGEARVIVLSSTGKHFTAGMDLAVFQGDARGKRSGGGGRRTQREPRPGARARARARRALLFQESFNALERARVPVLAAIQGGCIGGGVDMISACDVRYASEDAFFCIQEINLGLTADVGTLQRLPKLVPAGVVRELAYTGRRMPAARAKEVGLVNEVYPTHDALLAGVLAIAARDRGEVAARDLGQQADAELRARPLRRGRARVHRHLAGRHVLRRRTWPRRSRRGRRSASRCSRTTRRHGAGCRGGSGRARASAPWLARSRAASETRVDRNAFGQGAFPAALYFRSGTRPALRARREDFERNVGRWLRAIR